MQRAEPILEKEKKKLLLEADPSVNTTNHTQLARLLELLKPEQFGAIYDPGNDLFDPDREEPFPTGYESIRNYLVHVHVKDAVYDSAGLPVCVAPGMGNVGYERLLKQLMADHYDGWLSLEPHYRKNVVLTEKQMRLPQGAEFSFGGMEAAEESAQALMNLLNKLNWKPEA
jgi:sugar phosphate isomerase/epimerase